MMDESLNGATPPLVLGLEAASLGQVMPMYVIVSPTGHIRAVGPTLGKIWPYESLIGSRFLEVFTLRRPQAMGSMADLVRLSGTRLNLNLRAPPKTGFKGIVVPLADEQGVLLNLSFGIDVAQAVRDHKLTNRDFAPTDLTIEMLYLTEAKSAVMAELRKLNLRLHGAKVAAEEQALTDTLTGLRNRRALDLTLDKVAKHGTPFGLMHIDLDYFKQVNDTLGHAAGDVVLQHVAQVLRGVTRASDTVARVGGDEFTLIFPELVNVEKLVAIGQRILVMLQDQILFEGQACTVSASVGVTVSTFYHPPVPERMLWDADRALYASKNAGRSRVTAFADGVEGHGKE